jgi:uncharacterized membrane protein
MDTGPVDLLVVEFPGNKFSGEIVPAIKELVEDGIITVLDLRFIAKDADGSVTSMEIAGLGADLEPLFADLEIVNNGDFLDDEDAADIAALLDPGSSVGVLVVENTWARRFVTALRHADARVLDMTRIPADEVEQALKAGND